MNIFVICPMRGATIHEQKTIETAVAAWEAKGYHVHWPPRDTDQEDPSGGRICSDNLHAIRDADVVATYFNPQSKGSLFDLGMAWALDKALFLMNDLHRTPMKSFVNVVIDWAKISAIDELEIPEPPRCSKCDKGLAVFNGLCTECATATY